MPRNLDRGVEIAFPVLDPALQNRLKQILEAQLGPMTPKVGLCRAMVITIGRAPPILPA
jgi:polyphosphate kinase